MAAPPIRDSELAFLRALERHGARYLVVGLSAAALQGAPAATVDVDLWFPDPAAPEVLAALRDVGGTYVAPTGTTPPLFVGDAVSLFDVVVHMHGLGSFDEEGARAVRLDIGGVEVPVLPLERIIASKRATRRPKDLAILPALEAALRSRDS